MERDSRPDLQWVSVEELLSSDPYPPRQMDPPLDFLMSSVRLHGILAPLLVRRLESGHLQVVCGHRRLLAARHAEIDEVPVLISDLSDSEAVRCYLSENICRQDLSDIAREQSLDLLKALRADEDVEPIEPSLSESEISGSRLGWRYRGETSDEEQAAIDLLVVETTDLFRVLRSTRQLDMQRAESIVGGLLDLTDNASWTLSADNVYDASSTSDLSDTWLAAHSLLSASLTGSLGPREVSGLGRTGYALAGLLHDIGMVFLDSKLYARPEGLTLEQKRELQSHTRIGHALIQAAGKDYAEIALAARDHHERLDGSGYPGGQQGDLIGRLVRVMAMSDTFAALVGPRPHRRALTVEQALDRVAREVDAGRLDAQILRTFESRALRWVEPSTPKLQKNTQRDRILLSPISPSL